MIHSHLLQLSHIKICHYTEQKNNIWFLGFKAGKLHITVTRLHSSVTLQDTHNCTCEHVFYHLELIPLFSFSDKKNMASVSAILNHCPHHLHTHAHTHHTLTLSLLPSTPKAPPITHQNLLALLNPLPLPALPLPQYPNSHPPLLSPLIPNLSKLCVCFLGHPAVVIDESSFVALLVGVNADAFVSVEGKVVTICLL